MCRGLWVLRGWVWTGGSGTSQGGMGGGVAWYEDKGDEQEEPPTLVKRRGILGVGDRTNRPRLAYREKERSFRGAGSGWSSV